MTKFRTYKDVNTGKYAEYPEDFGALFYDTLVEVDPDTLQCLDCAKHQVEISEVDDVTDVPEPIVPVVKGSKAVTPVNTDLDRFDTDYDKSKDNK